MASDYSEVVPPSNVTVQHDHKAVLYLPDGRALVRQAGFRVEAMPTLREEGRQEPKGKKR